MREARRKGGKAEDREGEYITSLARGLSVLRAFSKERPEMTLSQLASATQLSDSDVAEYSRWRGKDVSAAASFLWRPSITIRSISSSTTKWLKPPEAITATVASSSQASTALAMACPSWYERRGVGVLGG